MPPIHKKWVLRRKEGKRVKLFQTENSFMEKEAREAKGLVPEHYRNQLLKVQKRVSERTVKRILGEQKKHKAQETSFSSHGKTHKVPKRVTDN
jgi:hypothetical protein